MKTLGLVFSLPVRAIAGGGSFCSAWLWLVLVAGLAWPGIGLADGKIFATAKVKVQIPDQRAMLHFSNGVERLVIETAFVGQGSNFAWVVPLPAQPTIEPVSTNFFNKLEHTFAPKLAKQVPPYWFPILAVCILAVYLRRLHLQGNSLGNTICAFFTILFVAGIASLVLFLPFLVKARGLSTATVSNGVEVLQSKRAGIYDTVTLSGKDGKAVVDWLNRNQFFVPPETLPVMEDYARQGWVFCAARLHPSASEQRNAPHPLAFTFATVRPVYPLRLTGVGNAHCQVRLFIFGPSRAEMPGFKLKYCALAAEPPRVSTSDASMPIYQTGNPELIRWGAPAEVATKLEADLSPQAMQADGWINWGQFTLHQPMAYSYGQAFTVALNWLVGLAVPAVTLLGFFRPRIPLQKYRRFRLGAWAAGIGSALLIYGGLPKVEVIYQNATYACLNNLRQIDGAKAQWALEFKKQWHELPNDSDLIGADKYIRVMPYCPVNGTYTFGAVGESPSCSIHGELP